MDSEAGEVWGRSGLTAKGWGRAVRKSLACGSAACVVMVVARLDGHMGSHTDTMLAGDMVAVHWDGPGKVVPSDATESVF